MNQRQGRVWRRIVVLVLVVALAGCGQFWKKRQARHDVRELKKGLTVYLQEQGQYPEGTAAEISKLLRGETVAGQNRPKLGYIEARTHEVNPAGEFVDPWGHPYHLAPGTVLPVYSNGPNGLDERGAGDDITD